LIPRRQAWKGAWARRHRQQVLTAVFCTADDLLPEREKNAAEA
jgi:hypothetical protein